MRTAVVTDSNSGIFEAEARTLGIFVVPMPVVLEGNVYYEGVDLQPEEFYRSLEEHKNVSTSQPAPGEVTAIWDLVLRSGYDELVYIPMSSGLSNSCQTALGLAEQYKGAVQVVNNHRISVTQRQSVLDALALARQGCSAREIKARLEAAAMDSLIYVGVETMEYLRKGGRVTAAAAAMGTILNLKPLLIIQGERLDAYAKVRGTRNCRRRLIEAMQAYAEKLRGEQKGPLKVGAAGSFARPEEHEAWAQMVREAFPRDEVQYDPLTFSVGCHVGPGAFGMGISTKAG